MFPNGIEGYEGDEDSWHVLEDEMFLEWEDLNEDDEE